MYGKLSLFSKVVRIYSVRYYKKDTKKLLEFLASMPKPNSGRIAEAQRQRQTISKKSEKYGPSTVYLQVLGSGARGAPNTLYLFTDQKRYLFNCGEGTQRLAHEHKVKLSRLDHIFITNKTWRNIGGLPGLSLTLQDVGVPHITLHGPEGLDELYNATRRFVVIKDMNVEMATCSKTEDFEDNVMTVKYVLMGPPDNILSTDPKPAAKKPKLDDKTPAEFEEFIHDDTDYYNSEASKGFSKNKNMTPKPKPNVNKDFLKKKTEKVLEGLQKLNYSSVAYICILKKRLGTLDLEKCVEMGVKPGPLLGQLKSGQDVVLPDGRLVLSKDVKTPDDPGPVFIVLEVPDVSYLNESEFAAHFDNGKNPLENIPTVVVHYTPPHVLKHQTYRSFMLKFGPSTRHLVLNAQNACLGSEAVHRSQHKLHLLDADMFPLLRDASVPALWTPSPPHAPADSSMKLKGLRLEELKNKIALAQFQNIISMESSCGGDAGLSPSDALAKLDIIAARTLTMFHLRPKKELDRSAEPKLHIQEYIRETMDADGFVASLEQFRQVVDSLRYARSDSREYPRVVFLGTGSCIPSKTRNTSAIVIQVDENRSMLLDCGEGTFGQLVRFYGPKRVNAFLRTLSAIYVSHLHADHHIGLIGVLQARRQAFEELDQSAPVKPLYLLAPGQIVTWLSIYDHQFEPIREDFTLIPNQSLLDTDAKTTSTEMTSAVLASIGVQAIRTCLVAHCPNAFGVAIDVDNQYKITYSGDTIPCEELVRIGKNSTLLIHEATMEDELADEARIKMHSTTSQAIDIGRQMEAKYTVLTHFSQRYARLPRLNFHILNDNSSVGIAFDNMQITMSDLELLPHMYAPLQLMFAEHCVELELKAQNRARQKKRKASSPALPSSARSRRSPCCLSAASTPGQSPLRYRESHASRLRLEKNIADRRSVSRSQSCSPTKPAHIPSKIPTSGRCSASHLLDRSQIRTPRTPSESSSVGTKRIKDRTAPSSLTRTCVIDTRSKTLNAATASGLPDVTADIFDNTDSVADTDYGNPLMTSVKKRQSLRNGECAKTSGSINSPSPVKILRPPIKAWRAEHTTAPSTTGRESSRPKFPTKPVSGSNEKTRGFLSGSDTKSDTTSLIPRRIATTKSIKPQQRANQRQKPSEISLQEKPIRKLPIGGRFSSPQKHELIKENFKSQAVNPSKSFKPQLEDIKSSFLLLNNKNIEINTEIESKPKKDARQVQDSKPQSLNETERRKLLLEAMNKYRTKKFFHDTKYDKIEGLNWISWK